VMKRSSAHSPRAFAWRMDSPGDFMGFGDLGNKKRGRLRPRCFSTLYFYFSNLGGVNRKGF
jgi:hypothetical protein